MTRAKAGCLAVIGDDGRLVGVFTDGDLRRSALAAADFLQRPLSAHMTRRPITVREDVLAVEALRIFEASHIDDLLVIDAEGRPIGIVDGQDLPHFHLV
jgi:arabinose-5-phosphate isomerase